MLASRLAEQQAHIGQLESKISQMKASGDFTTEQLNQSQEEIARQASELIGGEADVDQPVTTTADIAKGK